MSSSPGDFFVPTLDIDLAWHTHQLMGNRYQEDCMKYIGRYVDQSVGFRTRLSVALIDECSDDKVEEGYLAQSFDLTSRAWNVRTFIISSSCF